MDAKDYEAAFRSVHNLKGVALNLGLTPVHKASNVLCEALRPGNPTAAPEELARMYEDVEASYDSVVSSLRKMLG